MMFLLDNRGIIFLLVCFCAGFSQFIKRPISSGFYPCHLRKCGQGEECRLKESNCTVPPCSLSTRCITVQDGTFQCPVGKPILNRNGTDQVCTSSRDCYKHSRCVVKRTEGHNETRCCWRGSRLPHKKLSEITTRILRRLILHDSPNDQFILNNSNPDMIKFDIVSHRIINQEGSLATGSTNTTSVIKNPYIDTPAIIDQGTNNPAIIDQSTDSPAKINQGVDNLAIIDQGTDSPAIINQGADNLGTENPAIIDPGTDNLGTDNPAIIAHGTDNPALINTGTDIPSINNLGTESSSINILGTDNPSINNLDTNSPTVNNQGTDSPRKNNPRNGTPSIINPATDNPARYNPGTDSPANPGTAGPGNLGSSYPGVVNPRLYFRHPIHRNCTHGWHHFRFIHSDSTTSHPRLSNVGDSDSTTNHPRMLVGDSDSSTSHPRLSNVGASDSTTSHPRLSNVGESDSTTSYPRLSDVGDSDSTTSHPRMLVGDSDSTTSHPRIINVVSNILYTSNLNIDASGLGNTATHAPLVTNAGSSNSQFSRSTLQLSPRNKRDVSSQLLGTANPHLTHRHTHKPLLGTTDPNYLNNFDGGEALLGTANPSYIYDLGTPDYGTAVPLLGGTGTDTVFLFSTQNFRNPDENKPGTTISLPDTSNSSNLINADLSNVDASNLKSTSKNPNGNNPGTTISLLDTSNSSNLSNSSYLDSSAYLPNNSQPDIFGNLGDDNVATNIPLLGITSTSYLYYDTNIPALANSNPDYVTGTPLGLLNTPDPNNRHTNIQLLGGSGPTGSPTTTDSFIGSTDIGVPAPAPAPAPVPFRSRRQRRQELDYRTLNYDLNPNPVGPHLPMVESRPGGGIAGEYEPHVEVPMQKPGHCSLSRTGKWSPRCMDTCFNDADCPYSQKCCHNGCARSCQLPHMSLSPDIPAKKAGRCPSLVINDGGNIECKGRRCSLDRHCPGKTKCCASLICGRTCQSPNPGSLLL
ncbi:mucin-5AC [Patella vulgata]|uniref:mucin-5AC n=1 Tax=Patella vulgata TaxID=6465 RepID=UPI00217FA952|nr:mucin-5AC [Patella vulgata]